MLREKVKILLIIILIFLMTDARIQDGYNKSKNIWNTIIELYES